MKTLLIVLLLSLAALGQNKNQQWFRSASELRGWCLSFAQIMDSSQPPGWTVDNDEQAWRCAGYIEGVVDMADDDGHRALPFCSDQPVRNEQEVKIFLSYLTENPEDLNKAAQVVVLASLAKAFPCK